MTRLLDWYSETKVTSQATVVNEKITQICFFIDYSTKYLVLIEIFCFEIFVLPSKYLISNKFLKHLIFFEKCFFFEDKERKMLWRLAT